MNNEAIEILTRIYIEEFQNGNINVKYEVSKGDLIKFCIKLLKEIERY